MFITAPDVPQPPIRPSSEMYPKTMEFSFMF
jgi:hypothetical protein